MVKKIILFFFMSMFSSAFLVYANAEDYIVKFVDDYTPIVGMNGLKEIDYKINLFQVDNLDSIKDLQDYIDYIEVDDSVELIDSTDTQNNSYSVFGIADDTYKKSWQLEMIKVDFAWELKTYGNDVNL